MAKRTTTDTESPKKSAPKKKAAKKSTTTAKKAAAKKPAARKPVAAPEGDGAVSAKGKSLVIVESPAKAKTIEKYLKGNLPNFSVMASVGHIIDLPVSKLGVDVENEFEPQYEVIKGKKAIVDSLKKRARAAERVYLAPDPDREGEAIAYHIAQVIGNGSKQVYRAVFNEVTKDAIIQALQQPTEINTNLFNAQQARRILDRLVGYKVSPLLWKKVKYGLSAGRVQSVALRLICDREREIRVFVPEEYWSIWATAEKPQTPPPFHLKLDKIEDKKPVISNKESADAIIGEVQGQPFVVSEVIKKEVAKRPFAPFITSTLQQEASRKLRYSASRTMRIAQRLYEGVELGEDGPQGLITYMRTDSTRLSQVALDMVRGYIGKNFNPEYLPEGPRVYSKGKSAQDAHEAIRPTDISRTPESLAPYLEKDMLELYRLIWTRTIASQMADAKTERTRVEVPVGKYLFVATGSVMKFPGFMAIYEEARDEAGKSESDSEGLEPVKSADDESLPPIEKGDRLDVQSVEGKQHFTQPPPRFTEASLIKELEKQGIGRPSTYAAIIQTIQDREYAMKDGGSFKPTDLGFLTTDLLIESFPQIMDVKFTALMENQLDEVEEGRVDWVELLKNFYKPFQEKLEEASRQMRNVKAEMLPTEHVCEKCGSPMVVRWGRNGRFLACSAYPNCKNTKPVVMTEEGKIEVVPEETTDEKCPTCGADMVVKSGRRGRFLACSAYPECKTTKPLPIGVKCPRPGCEGELLERRSMKGKVFYSCSKYPECKFSVWERPLKAKCETCGEERFVMGKPPKQKVFGCAREDCPYTPAYTGEPEPAQEGGDGAEKPAGRRGFRRRAAAKSE